MSDAKTIAKRMLWLAYQASRPVGMGMLHFTEDKTEEEIGEAQENEIGYAADYCFGRMMKFGVRVNGDSIEYSDFPLSADYQSWSIKYRTYSDLEAAARESLKALPTGETP